MEFAGKFFRNLSAATTVLKRREIAKTPGGAEGIELTSLTQESSIVQDSPTHVTRREGNLKVKQALKSRKPSRRGNIKDSRQLSRKDVANMKTAERVRKYSDMEVNKKEWAEISGILDRFKQVESSLY